MMISKENLLTVYCLILAMLLSAALVAQPTATDVFPLTFEENDFPPAVAGQNVVFQTAAGAKNRFVMVFRNGILQRPCAAGVSTGCDYQKSGNVTVTFPAIADQDLVTMFYYR